MQIEEVLHLEIVNGLITSSALQFIMKIKLKTTQDINV